MRTTIRLDDQLLRQAKELAVQTDRTLTEVIEDALRQSMARRRRGTSVKRIRLPTVRGRGLLPGVDLDDSAGLRDLMDRSDAVDRR